MCLKSFCICTRTVSGVADSTRRKLIDLLRGFTGRFILQDQEPGRRKPMLLREAMGSFAFRYSLCMLPYYIGFLRLPSESGPTAIGQLSS